MSAPRKTLKANFNERIMMNTVPWRIIKNSSGQTMIRGRTKREAVEKFEQRFGIDFCLGSGYAAINDDLSHFERKKYSGAAKYDWPVHDRLLVKCRDYDEYRLAMIVSGVDPAPKGTVQGRRSTFRTAGFKVSSWRRDELR